MTRLRKQFTAGELVRQRSSSARSQQWSATVRSDGWEFVPVRGGLGKYRAAWDNFNDEFYFGNPYFAADFTEPLLKHFGAGNERLGILRDRGEVMGLMLLAPRKLGIWTIFARMQAQVVPAFVRNERDLESALKRLPAVALDIPLQDPNASPMKRWGSRHALTMSVELEGTFERYWKARPANLIDQIARRHRKTLRELGEYRLVLHTTGMPDLVRRFGDMESRGWKGKEGTAVGSNDQGAFYADVMSRFEQQQRAVVYELRIGDRTVALQLALRGDRMLVLLKSTYDEELAKFGPGRHLKYALLQNEFDLDESDTVEFYTDANSDLLAWATEQRHIQHHRIFRYPIIEKMFELRDRLRAVTKGASSP